MDDIQILFEDNDPIEIKTTEVLKIAGSSAKHHADLQGLDYESSGHIGFASQTDLNATNKSLADVKSKVDNFFSGAGVDGVIDTLNEIVEYIEKDEQGAIDLARQVANNTSQIESVANTYASKEYVTTNIQQYIDEAIDGALEGNY